jgi:hypothetical protein
MKRKISLLKTSSEQTVKQTNHVVSHVWWPKSGTPVSTEQLLTEGSWFEACFGHVRKLGMCQSVIGTDV